MVLKKRCDFCLKIKQDNLNIGEKILNRVFQDVLVAIAGVEIVPEQLANILTCFECAVSIVHAEPTVLKVRNLLTKLSKSKVKKKLFATGSANNTDASTLDPIGSTDSDGVPKVGDEEESKPPAKIKNRRTTIATSKLLGSLVNGALDGPPVASSTMTMNETIIEKKTKAKKPREKKAAKPTPVKAKNEETTKPSANKNEESEIADDGTSMFNQPKSFKQTILEREKMTEVVKSPKKVENESALKSPQKRTISQSSKDSHEAINNSFKKFKGTSELKYLNADLGKSQDSNSDGEKLHECFECGKTFRVLGKYEKHVLSQKCLLASISCKHPDCSRRFFKLDNMLEHVQKKHQAIFNEQQME